MRVKADGDSEPPSWWEAEVKEMRDDFIKGAPHQLLPCATARVPAPTPPQHTRHLVTPHPVRPAVRFLAGGDSIVESLRIRPAFRQRHLTLTSSPNPEPDPKPNPNRLQPRGGSQRARLRAARQANPQAD